MPTPTKVQLINGSFQDSEGNLLANGYLEMQLSQDGLITGVGQIASGVTIKITLDGSGNVAGTQSVWGNDQMSPVNSYYRVTGFTSAGQPAWGPNNQQVNGSGGTFDVGTWIPNQVISWTSPSVQSGPALQVDGTPNTDQALLNLDSTMMFGRWADNGSGDVTLNIAEEQPDYTAVQLSSGVSTSLPNPFAIEADNSVNASLTSNVMTLSVIPANHGSYPLDAQGAHLYFSGFTGSWTFLNGQRLQILTYNYLTGAMTVSVTHADVASSLPGLGSMVATFIPVISYAGAKTSSGPQILDPAPGPPTNTGALWVEISSDWSTWKAHSTNASDNNWVNVAKLIVYN